MEETSQGSQTKSDQKTKPHEKHEKLSGKRPVLRCQRSLHKSFDAVDEIDHAAFIKMSRKKIGNLSNNPDCSLCKDWEHEKPQKLAAFYCHACNIYLCGSCAKRHKSVYKEHHFISSVSLSATKLGDQMRVNGYTLGGCMEEGHKDIPKYFCETCGDVVCLECIENFHNRHHFLYLKDAYFKHKAILDQYIAKAQNEALHISKQIEYDYSVLNDLRERKSDAAKQIKNHTATLIEALRIQEAQLLSDLDKMYTGKEAVVSKNKERCQNHLELINRTCKFTKKVINDASDMQVLVFKKYALKRLEEVSRPEFLITESDDINVNYFFAKKSPDHAKELLGHLVDSPVCPRNCVAYGDGLIRAIVGQEASFIVTAVGKNNQPLTTGGDKVQVRLSSTQEEFISTCVYDQGNGEYLVTYCPKLSGDVTISVRIYDQPIKDPEYKAVAICQRAYGKITEPFLSIDGLSHSNKEEPFKLPCGVAVDEKGRIFVADCHNHRIRITSREGNPIKTFGNFGSKNGQLNNPTDVLILNEKVYVCDKDNNRVQCFTKDGAFLFKFNCGGRKLKRPWGLCVDGAGNIIVVDTKNNCVQVFTGDGTFVNSFGSEGSLAGEFLHPYFATCHRNGDIYITDNGNHRVQVFDKTYAYLFQFGNDNEELALKNPTGITTDHQGNVIVADQCNSRLQVFHADGRRIAVIAKPLNDQECQECQSYPKGIAVTQEGYIVVADSDNDRILLL